MNDQHTVAKPLQWECPVHGQVNDFVVLPYSLPKPLFPKARYYCLQCIEDAILARGIAGITLP